MKQIARLGSSVRVLMICWPLREIAGETEEETFVACQTRSNQTLRPFNECLREFRFGRGFVWQTHACFWGHVVEIYCAAALNFRDVRFEHKMYYLFVLELSKSR